MSNGIGVELDIPPGTAAVEVAVPPISPPGAFHPRVATRVFQVTSDSRKNEVSPYAPYVRGKPKTPLAVACIVSRACLIATLGSRERSNSTIARWFEPPPVLRDATAKVAAPPELVFGVTWLSVASAPRTGVAVE